MSTRNHNNVKKFRLAKGMSQTELGDMVGLTKSAISKIENAERGLKHHHIVSLAKALNVSAQDIIGQENEGCTSVEYMISEQGLLEVIEPIVLDSPVFKQLLKPYTMPNITAASLTCDAHHIGFVKEDILLFQYEGQFLESVSLNETYIVGLQDGTLAMRTIRKGNSANAFDLEWQNEITEDDQILRWISPIFSTIKGGTIKRLGLD